MADQSSNVVEIILRAKDEAAANLLKVATEIGAIPKAAATLPQATKALDATADASKRVGTAGLAFEGLRRGLAAISAAGRPLTTLSSQIASLTSAFAVLGNAGGEVEALAKHLDSMADAAYHAFESSSKMGEGTTAAARGVAVLADECDVCEAAVIGLATASAVMAAGIAVAGIAAFAGVGKMAESAERLKTSARGLGTTPQNLQVIERVFKDAGYSAETAASALTFMSRAIAENDSYLKQLGIDAQDPYDAIIALSKAYQQSEDAGKKNVITVALLGREMKGASGVITELADKVGETRDRMNETGELFSDVALKNVDPLAKQINDLKGQFAGIGHELGATFLPLARAVGVILQVIAAGMHETVLEMELFFGLIGKGVDAAVKKWADFGSAVKGALFFFPRGIPQLAGFIPPVEAAKGFDAISDAAKGAADSLSKVTLRSDKTEDVSDREKHLQQLVKDSGLARDAVEQLMKAVDAEAAAERRAAALKELGFKKVERDEFGPVSIPVNVGDLPGAKSGLEKLHDTFNALRADMDAISKSPALDALAKQVAEAVKAGDFRAMSDSWNQAVGKMGDDAEDFSKRVQKALSAPDATSLSEQFDKLQKALQAIDNEPALDNLAASIANAVQSGDFRTMSSLWKKATDQMGDSADDLTKRVLKAFAEMKKARDAASMSAVVADWKASVEAILTNVGILNDSLQGLWNGLTAGFEQAFAAIFIQGQSFGAAMAGVFRVLVGEALRELARLAAAKVFLLLLRLLGGGGLPTAALSAAADFTPAPPALRTGAKETVPGLDSAQALQRLGDALSTAIRQSFPAAPEVTVVVPPPAPDRSGAQAFQRVGDSLKAAILASAPPQTAPPEPEAPARPAPPDQSAGRFQRLGDTFTAAVRALPRPPAPEARRPVPLPAPDPAGARALQRVGDSLSSVLRLAVRPAVPVDVRRQTGATAVEPISRRQSEQTLARLGDTIVAAFVKAAKSTPEPPKPGDIYNISTLDARNIVMSLTQPGGQLRKANDRVRLAGAF